MLLIFLLKTIIMSHHMRFEYLLHWRVKKAQTSLDVYIVVSLVINMIEYE